MKGIFGVVFRVFLLPFVLVVNRFDGMAMAFEKL
jgi:hypothetical protein